MVGEKLGGSPFDGLLQDDLFALADCRGRDLLAECARARPMVTYVALGPFPRDPFEAFDVWNDFEEGDRRRYRSSMESQPPTEAEVVRALHGLAAVLGRNLQESPEARSRTIKWLEENGGQTPGPRARLLALLKSTR
ncbi:hypothetical protein KBD61_04310 [Patescibacteria group bacterium]|nr:hypothetical protein [Patescibacteria group bacterium]MBP9710217.1 hypothetical protein [Patescibacteria group bacterium]